MKVGDMYKTNTSGLLTVTEIKKCSVVKVKFIETGYETETRKDQLKAGVVKDKTLVQRTRKATTHKFRVTFKGGEVRRYVKLVDVLNDIEDKDISKLYKMRRGLKVADHEVKTIEAL